MIECYKQECPYHLAVRNFGLDLGPFCSESNCVYTENVNKNWSEQIENEPTRSSSISD